MDLQELRSLQEAVSMVGCNRQSSLTNSGDDQCVIASITHQDINSIVENALSNVFYGSGQDLHEVETKETREGTKYKVRVKDRQTGSSYIRFATREKIAELRANPNISSVELTDENASGGNADGTSGKTQTFGASPNANRSSSQGYQRPQPVNRPPMDQRMAQRDRKATGGI